MVLRANSTAIIDMNLPRKGHVWPLLAETRLTDGPKLPKEEL